MTPQALRVLRTYKNLEIPIAGDYTIDPAHTSVEFVARNFVITKVRGRFIDVSGTITVGDEPQDSHVEALISVASLATGNDQRDRHLRSADFFDVARYPNITFASTSITGTPMGTWVVTGDLTIRDITRPVSLDVAFDGASRGLRESEHIVFSTATEVNRDDWRLGWNAPAGTGGAVIGKHVRIELNVQAMAADRVAVGDK